MPRQHKHDPYRAQRLAWLAQNINKAQTDAQTILGLMAAFPGTNEQTARRELNELYERYFTINQENIEFRSAQFLEIGFDLLKDARQAYQLGPAVNLFKTLAQIAGVLTEKVQVDQTVNASPTPAPEIVRERIAELMRKRKTKQEAEEAGINLDDLAKKAGHES